METKETFGQFVHELRILKGLTLREFSGKINYDPSNWSKIERGVLAPPQAAKSLEIIRQVLGVDSNSEEFRRLHDLAFMAFVPNELKEDKRFMAQLPVFFRSARGVKVTDEELNNLINYLKSNL